MQRMTRVQRRLEEEFRWSAAEETCLVPHSRADAAALRRRAAAGEVVEPSQGIFLPAPYWDALAPTERAIHLMVGLAQKHPSWSFHGASAALAWGLDVPYSLALPVQVMAARPPAHPTEEVRVRQLPRPVRTVVRCGLNVSEPLEAVTECLLEAPFPSGLAVADAALRQFGWTREELLGYLGSEAKGRTGVRCARITASLADARAENGGESRARAFFIMHGFMLPELQVEIHDPTDSARVFRADFFWELPDGRGIIGEHDGMQKYTDEGMLAGRTAVDVLVAERQRESHLTLAGYPVVRFTPADLRDSERMEGLLRAAGVPHDSWAALDWAEAWRAACPPQRRYLAGVGWI